MRTPTHFDFLVFIGRFQPFHVGHHAIISRGLRLADRIVVMIGSANKPRSLRNPWNVAEREAMIRSAFPDDSQRLLIRPLTDHLYDDALWTGDVQRIVAATTRDAGPLARIGLLGYHKDASSFYLDSFPQWEQVNCPNVAGVSASDLRDYLFAGAGDIGKDLLIKAAVPEPVFAMLKGFRDGPQFPQLVREHEFIRNYRKSWAAAPYEPTFVTVDAVVTHSRHVLLVRRGSEPGKGLWALPGGFLERSETLQSAALRELREETGLDLPLAALKDRAVFDHPDRSLRGRTITHAFHFDLSDGELPPVAGADDAETARWIALGEALEMEEQFFEDHFHILQHFLNRS
jgi:bifunctional NMN adenylyltransferase/nudix hydrolase